MAGRCPKCNSIFYDNSAFCNICGSNLIPFQGNIQQQPFNIPQNMQPQQYEKPKSNFLLSGIVAFVKVFVVVFVAFIAIVFLSKLFFDDEEDTSRTNNDYTYTNNQSNTQSTTQTTTETTTEAPLPSVVFSEQVIYDENDCKITLTSGDENSLSFLLENNTDKSYSFSVHSMAINSVMTDCNIYTSYTDVGPGKKSNIVIDFDDEWLEFVDGVPEKIEMIFWMYDNDTYMKDIDTGLLQFYCDKPSDTHTLELTGNYVEDNGIQFSMYDYEYDYIDFIIFNTNDYYVDLDICDFAINDYSMDTGLDARGFTIYPGAAIIQRVNIRDEFKELNGFTGVGDYVKFESRFDCRIEDDYFNSFKTDYIVFE